MMQASFQTVIFQIIFCENRCFSLANTQRIERIKARESISFDGLAIPLEAVGRQREPVGCRPDLGMLSGTGVSAPMFTDSGIINPEKS